MLLAAADTTIPPEVAQITVSSLVVWLTFIASLLSALLIIKRRVQPFFTQLRNFLSDWSGEPARPGVKRKPGVMERLSGVEHQLLPNSGDTIYDVVHKLSRQVTDLAEKQEDNTKRIMLIITYFGSKDSTFQDLVRKQDEVGLH